MRSTEDASQTIERIAARLDDPSSAPELRSHLHEAAERQARARGAEAVEASDVAAAVEEAGGERALARAFLRRPAAPPATLSARVAAHAVDLAVVYGLVYAFWTLSFIAFAILGGIQGHETWWPRPNVFQPLDVDDATNALRSIDAIPLESLMNGLLVGAMVVGAPLAYFVVGDMRGQTLGKRALRLRVEQLGGGRASFVAALARSLPKATPLLAPLLLLDGLASLRRPGQRATDRAFSVRVVGEPAPTDNGDVPAHAST